MPAGGREASRDLHLVGTLVEHTHTHKIVFFSFDFFSSFVLFLRFIIVIAKQERNCKEKNVLQELHSFDFASYKLMGFL